MRSSGDGLVIGHPQYGDYNVSLCYIVTRESIVDPNNYLVISGEELRIASMMPSGLYPATPLLKEKT